MEPIETVQENNIEEVKQMLDTNSKGAFCSSILNDRRILEYDVIFKGKIRYNELSDSIYLFGGLPWNKHKQANYRPLKNSDIDYMRCYFDEAYHLSNLSNLETALNVVSYDNSFNPIIEYLEGLSWDGEAHVENLLTDYLGVENSAYNIAVIRLLMFGMCARAYRPGTKFDYMPVLQGAQGDGKSTFVRMLALDDEWFTDSFPSIEGVEALEKLRGMWLVEFGELLATKRAKDVEGIKAFISSVSDRYRKSYGRVAEDYPRRCCFIGTTNQDYFLSDRTGNRRFLPIRTDKKKATKSLFTEEARNDFIQAWAETLYYYKKGEYSLVMPQELVAEIENAQADCLEDDPRIGMIEHFLSNKEKICIQDIWENCLELPGQPTRKQSNELHQLMKTAIPGWKKADKTERYGRYGVQRGYYKIDFKTPFE